MDLFLQQIKLRDETEIPEQPTAESEVISTRKELERYVETCRMLQAQ